MLACQKNQFDLPPEVTYLNMAYMSPLPHTVMEAGVAGLRKKARPYEITVDDFFQQAERVRGLFARLIQAPEPKRIAFVPAVSYGMATIARNLPLEKGQNIVVAGEQFPSNVYPWRSLAAQKGAQIRYVGAPEVTSNRGQRWNEQLLEDIDAQTAMVAIAPVHWSDGTVFDLMALRKRTHEMGAWLVIDGTQSVGALPFDVQTIQPEALICAGYKWLLGPYTSGYAYFSEVFDGGKPIEESWISRFESENFANLVNYQDQYQPMAMRYEMGGRSNFINLPMMEKGLEWLLEWTAEGIQAYCEALSQDIFPRLQEAGFQLEEKPYRAAHLFGVRPPNGVAMDKIREALVKEQIMVSYRGDAMRVAPFVYNEREELEKFAAVMLSCL